jgi:hypothetical protein
VQGALSIELLRELGLGAFFERFSGCVQRADLEGRRFAYFGVRIITDAKWIAFSSQRWFPGFPGYFPLREIFVDFLQIKFSMGA